MVVLVSACLAWSGFNTKFFQSIKFATQFLGGVKCAVQFFQSALLPT